MYIIDLENDKPTYLDSFEQVKAKKNDPPELWIDINLNDKKQMRALTIYTYKWFDAATDSD